MKDTFKIPQTINITLVVVSTTLCTILLYVGSHTSHFAWTIVYGACFALVMICVYSLIHEAEHGILHGNEKINLFLGRWLCLFFIAPFTFFKHCHLKHHKKNRTDEEMWDLYYEHEDKLKRYGTLYGMMIGLGYFALWLSVILFAIWPRLVYTRPFLRHREISGFVRGSYRRDKLIKSQLESIGVIIFQVLLFYVLELQFWHWLTMYVINGFVWSSQNYVNHAFSPRDIINGAHNLGMPIWMKYVYLNFNLHLAHHQDPKIPWIHLQHHVRNGKQRITFLRNYLNLWKGPQLTKEPPPKANEVE